MDVASFLHAYGIFIVAMAGAGMFGGLIAGLLGVGGGIVIVPVLYVVFGAMGVPEDIRMKCAVATSLATILVTSLSSARGHAKRNAVDASVIRGWAIPIVIGVAAGTLIASHVRGAVLTAVFATVAMLVAINMVLRGAQKPLRQGFPSSFVRYGSGIAIGLISAMMGIGGGTLSVPILTAIGTDIRRAVGTASAIGFLIAIPGTLGYMLAGRGVAGLPPGSVGYVNLLAFAALVPLTALFAPVGARIAHAIPQRALSYAFAVFLVATSLNMIRDLLMR